MAFGLGEVAHQNCHPFLHTLGFESYHASLVPMDFRVRSKAQDLPYHSSLGPKDIRVQSKVPNPLFPKEPSHPLPTNAQQTSMSSPSPQPQKWQECPNPAPPERPNHHQKRTTAPLHTPFPQPPTATVSSACKKQQAPPTARGTPESKSPPAESPAQIHLCARVLAVVPRLKKSRRWSGLS